MKNNFNFNASIKIKDLERMESVIDLLYREKIDNKDLKLCIAFRNLLDSYDNIAKPKMYDLVDDFASFYEDYLYPYCKGNIVCDRIEEFDFEHVQYVMDKMKEIIGIIYGSYGL